MPLPDPVTRKEIYLNAAASGSAATLPDPVTREEIYLKAIAENGGGGGGGSTSLSGLTDVDISNPSNGQTLVYNATSGKWENGAGGGILHVGLDMSTFTLDKTWQEIYDSDLSVLKIETPDGRSKDAYMLSTAYIEGTEGVNASYGVTFYCITTENSQPSMEAISFSASARNDYPAINSPE